MQTKDVWFVYEAQTFGSHRRTDKFLIDSFQFEGETVRLHHTEFKETTVTGKQFVKLLCRCGSCDFNEDGRFMNEYCCQSCGKYVLVHRRFDHENQKTPNQ